MQHKINVVSSSNDGMDGQALAEQEGHADVVKLIKDWKSHVFDEVILQLEGIQQFGDPRITLAINLIKDVKGNAN